MSADLTKATSIVRDYLRHRDEVRSKLAVYTNDGMRAQSLTPAQATGKAILPDPDGDRGAPVSDPTGETVAHPRGDVFRDILEACEASELRLMGSANRLVGHTMVTRPAQLTQILDAYRGGDETFNRLIRSAADVFAKALGHTIDGHTKDVMGRSAAVADCQSCLRLKLTDGPWRRDPTYNDGKPTDVKGILPKRMRLCRGCEKFVSAEGRLPSLKELRHRHDDPRDHWPDEGRKGKAA